MDRSRTTQTARAAAGCILAAVGAAVIVVALASAGCGQPPAMLREIEARQRVANMSAQFHKASEATNRAVMADTDGVSQELAGEARASLAKAQAELDAARPLLEGLGYQPESSLMDAFSTGFARYRELDERILTLAVENTNLKAQRLSFDQASSQADAVVAFVASVVAAGTDWRLRATANEAVAALRELQLLQAPHIAAAEDTAMTGLEQQMTGAEARVHERLQALATLAPAASRAGVAAAASAFEAFMATHREILALSRRNTNVRSLALVLNEKGALTRTCDETLQALATALESHAAYGSR